MTRRLWFDDGATILPEEEISPVAAGARAVAQAANSRRQP
jgi:hypothetical protein